MHLYISLVFSAFEEAASDTRKADPTSCFFSKNKTAAFFAASSVASLTQKFMAAAKGKPARPFFSSHWSLLISTFVLVPYFGLAIHDGKNKTMIIEKNTL